MSQEARMFIQAIDDFGEMRNLCCRSWSAITGKSHQAIRNTYNKKLAGKFDITNRQVVGLDEANLRKIAVDKNKKPRVLTDKQIMLNNFFRKALI